MTRRRGQPAWSSHAAFAPFARWLSQLEGDAAPRWTTLDRWVRERALVLDGRAMAVVQERLARRPALDYERFVRDRAAIPVRAGSWHDAMNVLAWIAFPQLKGALNARHLAEGQADTPNRRTVARDAATLVDESGLVVVCDAPAMTALLRRHAWRELFAARPEVPARHFIPFAVGHGLLDRLRAPFRALTARAMVIEVAQCDARPEVLPDKDLDAHAAALAAAPTFRPRALAALPVAALPGWDSEALGDALFDDVSVFRPKVLRSPSPR